MRVININVNGLRAAYKKGFLDWVLTQTPDIVCVQEIKAHEQQLKHVMLPGYHAYYHAAEKKGYSGVAMYVKNLPDKVSRGVGFDKGDREGRYLQLDWGKLSVVSLYLPSGTCGENRQAVKMEFLASLKNRLMQQIHDGRRYIFCGDWNIAHKRIDLKNWQANQKNSGFLLEERAWLDFIINELGYVDAFRIIDSRPEQYTWWSNRCHAYANNVGWRIDYQLISSSLAKKVHGATIFKERRFSDHAPLIIDYRLD